MKKKGFTLVELLAVIAILAILVIIALPNVMKLFNDAKKNSFTNEVKEIYKSAQQQWMTESMVTTAEKKYARGQNNTELSACGTTKLELSGRTQLEYGITLDRSGNVTNFVATDGSYYFNYPGTAALTIEQIGGTGQNDPQVQAVSGTANSHVVCNGTNTDYQLNTAS